MLPPEICFFHEGTRDKLVECGGAAVEWWYTVSMPFPSTVGALCEKHAREWKEYLASKNLQPADIKISYGEAVVFYVMNS
jgi:hypothetical protein